MSKRSEKMTPAQDEALRVFAEAHRMASSLMFPGETAWRRPIAEFLHMNVILPLFRKGLIELKGDNHGRSQYYRITDKGLAKVREMV